MACPICKHPLRTHQQGSFCRSCNMVFSQDLKTPSRRKRKSLINHHFGGW